ncbi:MAG: TIGR01212 family radical SAM protein [Ruminococcus sp.]|nr:TIGR01212 family radical SAM protein [Ruminococcus sp.]
MSNKQYYSLNEYYKNKFGKKVYKLSINGGMTCPNRDGTLDTRGCVFCSEGGSGEFSAKFDADIISQLNEAEKRVKTKTKDNLYIAYLQPFTNTYADVEYLRNIYYKAIEPDNIVGLSIATRPDCLGGDILALLKEINMIKPVTVELGLQTIHKTTADYIRRGYDLEVFDKAVKKLHEIGVEVVTHIIIGLPFETEEMILESVEYAGRVTDGIKLQLLHIIKGTDLEIEYRNNKFEVLSLEKYTDIICKSIELLPKNVVIHRITGDGDKKSLIAPLWSADKKRVLNYINKQLDLRNVKQGSKL